MRASPYYNARSDVRRVRFRSAIDRFRASWRVRRSRFEPHGRGLSSGGGPAVSIPADPEKKIGVARAFRRRPIDSGRAGGCANHHSTRNDEGYPAVVAASNASPGLWRKKTSAATFFSIATPSRGSGSQNGTCRGHSATADR